MINKIQIDVNNPYRSYVEATIHELDSYDVEFYFIKDGQPLNIDIENDYDCFLTMTINNVLITDNVTVTATSDNKGVVANLGSTDDYTIFPGMMKLEFKLVQADPAITFCPLFPVIVNVNSSVVSDSTVDRESVGSVADLIRAIPDINAFLANPIPAGSVSFAKLTTQLQETINEAIKATTVITGNLTTLSTLNTARDNDRIYTYLLAPGTLFTNQPAAYPVKALFVNTTQIIIGGDGYVFARDYNSTTETWSSITCPLKDLEARVTALEAVDTILSNALNGVSE